ncbi:MAG: hypothetical protein ABSF26_27145 [Thermoguttaceae bacterium]|jgi:putative effector of murein hydrolase LrgA (UPF0299 family)
MDFWSSFLVSLVLLASAAGLMVWHVRSWRSVRGGQLEPREVEFHRRQYRRRMQTSAMLAVLGLAILAGQQLTSLLGPKFAGPFWGGVLLLVAWMALLALADILATQQHFFRLRNHYLVERAKLQAELRRVRPEPTNGKAKKKGEG